MVAPKKKPTPGQLANMMAMRDRASDIYHRRVRAIADALDLAGDEGDLRLYRRALTIYNSRKDSQ